MYFSIEKNDLIKNKMTIGIKSITIWNNNLIVNLSTIKNKNKKWKPK